MAKISLVESSQAPLRARPFFAKGEPGPIIATLAHVPELLDVTAPLLAVLFGQSAVPMRLKEIVVLRASARQQCRYCVQTHTALAREAGLTREEVIMLRECNSDKELFSDQREQVLLRWTDGLTTGPGSLASDLAEEMRKEFTEAEIVELTMLAGATIMLNRYCTALDLPTAQSTLQKLESEGLL